MTKVDITPEAVERLAKIVYEAMLWAYQDGSGNKGPAWQGGNSFAEDEARKAARAAIAAITPQEAAKVLRATYDSDVGKEAPQVDWQAVYVTMSDSYRHHGWGDWAAILDDALRAISEDSQ